MSTPEQPSIPGLTRRQLREIRMTGATPIVTPDMADAGDDAEAEEAAPQTEETAEVAADEASEAVEPEAPEVAEPAPVAPLPRAAEPIAPAPAPRPDAQVDLGAAPLTRRQAREQERIRTASVPVITPDVATAHSAPAPLPEPVEGPTSLPEPVEGPADSLSLPAAALPLPEPVEGPDIETPVEEDAADESADTEDEAPAFEPVSAASGSVDVSESVLPTDAEEPAPVEEDEADETEDADERPILRPEFGSGLASGTSQPLAPSFDELIARGSSSTGSLAAPNALILSQVPSAGALTSPIAATGEVLITGTLPLEGLGSRGHAEGTTDGKEVDAVLIDGELPPASSPTPIAASAAVSTIKGTGEIIRPPAPEKGNKLMVGLAITAGVLAVALVGVLILAFVTGVF